MPKPLPEVSRAFGSDVRRALAATAVLLLSFAAAACGRAPRTVFDADVSPRRLVLRTYEGSGQVVHPDVILVPELPGGPFWMAITPYPFSREKYENPSLYRSRDGFVWEEPKTAMNPIVPRPPYDHNCDPDLVRENGVFTLIYLETQRDEYRPDSTSFENLRAVTSRDGIVWTKPETRIHWDLTKEPFYLSPSLVRVDEGWRLYLVEPKANRVVWAPSSDLVTFGPVEGELTFGLEGVRPWHVDVFAVPGGWVCLLCARGPNAESNSDVDLWIGGSPDLERWSFREEPLLAANPSFLDTKEIYRSTGLVRHDRLVVWFSAQETSGDWFLAVTSYEAALAQELIRRASS